MITETEKSTAFLSQLLADTQNNKITWQKVSRPHSREDESSFGSWRGYVANTPKLRLTLETGIYEKWLSLEEYDTPARHVFHESKSKPELLTKLEKTIKVNLSTPSIG